MVRRRLKILSAVLLAPFIVLLVRLWSLQLSAGSHVRYLLEAHDQHTSRLLVPPLRGRILDRHGKPLAINQATFGLEFTLSELDPHPLFQGIAAISEEIGREQAFPAAAAIERHLRSRVKLERWLVPSGPEDSEAFLCLVDDVPRNAASRLLVRLEDHPAFEVSRREGRWQVLVAPRHAFRRELTLLRLSRLLPSPLTREALERRVMKRLEWIERRVAREVRSFEKNGEPDEGQVRRKERSARLAYRKKSWPLAEDVGLDAVTAIEYRSDEFPGIAIVDDSRRRYPLGEAAGALVGYLRRLGEADLERLRSEGRLLDRSRRLSVERFLLRRNGMLSRSDLMGSTGLESRYDERLRGLYGMKVVLRNNWGRVVSEVERLSQEDGPDLHTTLDAELQSFLYSKLREVCGPQSRHGSTGGSVMVMELPGGAVRASVGYPSFDPGRIHERGYREELNRLLGERSSWELERPTLLSIFPGSVFKLVTALAGLESGGDWNGAPAVGRRYPCEGTYPFAGGRLSCHRSWGHGPIELVDAIKHSCNSYFYYLADKHLDARRLHRWAVALGYGRPSGIDLPEPAHLAPGILVDPETTRRKLEGSALCRYSIGQVYVRATPAQVLRATAGIALRGRSLPRPWLVEPAEPELLPPIDEATIDALWEGMRHVVSDTGGTAGKPEYGLSRFAVAMKTGTAQLSSEESIYNAWICGFGPLPEPGFAFVIALERSDAYGGETCAPVASALLERLAEEEPSLLGGSSP